MYAIVNNQHGQEQWRLELNGSAPLDPDYYAELFAAEYGMDIEKESLLTGIPDGCEDFSVVIQEEPGSVVCWTSANYAIRGDA